jgi:CTP:phosphocholine cytidylyltransferase-like protein
MYHVILAGGSGSRFWPKSRENTPKQLLKILGEETMIRNTFNRLREIEDELINGGNIMGFVNYDDNYPIKIEAQKIGSDSKYFVNVNNKKYKFSNLSSGLYKLWGFEEINYLDGEVYNSGIWSPYQRAAKFALYPDTIDVRARWDVEGVNINFE